MKEPLIVIGIVGHARAGKDTAANILVSHHGFKRIALADGIKEAFNSLSGPTWDMHKDLNDEFNARRMMQVLGTECRKDLGADSLWIELTLAKIRYADHYHPKRISRFVIPDIRYPHEFDDIRCQVQGWGGTFECWRVRRNVAKIAESNHSSETEVDKVPVSADLCNDGTIGFLAHQVNGLIEFRSSIGVPDQLEVSK